MKIFWPHRPKVKGFSIENLASKYREKISNASSNEIQNKLLVDSNLKAITDDTNHMVLTNRYIKRGHWANRDFSEYREPA